MTDDDSNLRWFEIEEFLYSEIGLPDLCSKLLIEYVPPGDKQKRLAMFALMGKRLAREQRSSQPKPRGRPKGLTRAKRDVQLANLILDYAERNGISFRTRGLVSSFVKTCEDKGILAINSDPTTNRKRIMDLCKAIHAERRAKAIRGIADALMERSE